MNHSSPKSLDFLPALSQSGEISPDFCCFYGGGIRHNEDIMHSFQNFIVRLIPNHPPPLETRIWKLVVKALFPTSSVIYWLYNFVYISTGTNRPELSSGAPLQATVGTVYRDYFMVGECVRFLFTSCEGSLNERVSLAILHNE